MEALESRLVLSTATWTGSAGDHLWTTAANWQGSVGPVSGDDLVFPSGALDLAPVNDFAAGTVFHSIDIRATDYDVHGAGVELTGNLIGSLTSGVSFYELDTKLDSGVVNVASGGELLSAGVLSGSAGLELTGGGVLSLHGLGVNTYTGTTFVDSGTLTLDNIPGRFTVPGNLVIGGSGAGVVSEHASRQLNPTATVTVNTNGQLNLNGGQEFVGALNLNGNAQIYTGTSPSPLAGLLTLGGDLTADGTSGTPMISGAIHLGATDRTINVVAGNFDVRATVNGTVGLIKTGNGRLMLDNIAYNDTGAVTINAGVLEFIGGASINASSAAGITVASGATMQIYNVGTVVVPIRIAGNGYSGLGALLDSWYNDAVSNLILTGNASIGADTNPGLVVNNAIVDGGSAYSLTKVGNGRVTLAGANTYTGGTTINAGLLYVTGSIVGNAGTTANGQLGGTGTVGDVTTNGGTVGAGGSSIFDTSTEHYASLTLDSTATFSAEVNASTNGSFDKVIVAGAVALNDATLSLPNWAYNPGANDPIVLIQGATSLTGTFKNLPEGSVVDIGSYHFLLTYVGGAGGHDVMMSRIVATTTAVAIPPDSSVYSQSVTFTATVTTIQGGIATGTVTFYHGAVNLGTSTLNGSGVATLTTAALPVGGNGITATYNGDPLDLPSTSPSVTQFVVKDTTTTTITVPGAATDYGQSLTLTAHVAADAPGTGAPSGTVSFYDGATLLGTATLSGGTATYTSSIITPGAHSFGVSFGGDSGFFQSFSSPSAFTVNKDTTTASTPSTTGATAYGQSVTFTTTVTVVSPGAGTPTGTVTFYDGLTVIGTATLNGSGLASLTLSTLAAGTHSITASYAGDANDLAATSAATSQVVSQAVTTNTLGSSSLTLLHGTPVTLTATLAPVAPGAGVPTGTVTFFDGATSLGTGTLDPTGVATLITASLGFGPQSITAMYAGDANFQASTSTVVNVMVSLADPTVTIAASTNPAAYGQTVTFTTTVSPPSINDGTPTGTVAFYDGTTLLGTSVVVAGKATLDVSILGVATHAITATYGGDASFNPATTSALSEVVNAATTSATVAPPTSVTYGQSATLTASVTVVAPGVGTPTGTLSFYDGVTLLGSGAIDAAGSLTIIVPGLTAGSHSITARYAGDGNFAATNSLAATLTVDAAGTSTAITPISPVVFGQSSVYHVTVSAVAPGAGTPTGTVTFYDGATPVGIVTLSAGVASFDAAGLVVGSHTITAVYTGDANFLTSTSSGTSLDVAQADTTTALTIPTPVVYGQTATLKATVAPGAPGGGVPTGTVSFYDGATLLGTATIDGAGVATYLAANLAVGGHVISAVYAGDTNFTGSTTIVTQNQTVNQASSTATMAPTTAVVFGQSATLSATLAAVAPGGGVPTGSVSFYDGVTLLGTAVLDASGTATISLSTLAVGSHSITASYSGDVNFLADVSNVSTQVVNQASTTVAVPPPTGIVFGASATLAASVSVNSPGAGSPSGTVSFYNGPTFLGSATLIAGSASISVPGLAVGSYSITAVYSGDLSFLTATSSTATLVVAAEATTTTITPVTVPSVFGQSVTFTATVASNDPEPVNPTGTVTFYDGLIPIGTAALDGSDTATLTLNTLGAGSHTITASYNGDANFAPSNSLSTTQTVTKSGSASTLVPSLPSVVFGQTVALSASVAPTSVGAETPSGLVRFYDGATPLGTATLDGTGTATFNCSILSVGDHPAITAVYLGDANFTGSTTTAVDVNVTRASSSANVAPTTAVVFGQSATISASFAAVAPGTGVPTGSVSFYDGATLLGTALIDGAGTASMTTSMLAVGSHPITVVYAGDVNFTGSTSSAVAQVVSQASTTTAVAPPATIVLGQTATITVTVAPNAPGAGVPSGSVAFFNGATLIGVRPLVGAAPVSINVSGLAAGSYSITAVYNGDVSFNGSTSAVATLVVSQQGTTTTITPVTTPSVFGQSVTFTATVASIAPEAVNPTGQVSFYDGATLLGTAVLDGAGVATFSTSALPAGTHLISASYVGDTQFTSSTSASTTQTVSRATPTASLLLSSATTVYGQSLTLTASVASGLSTVPSGTVSFYDGATLLGGGTLDNLGSASFTASGLAPGSHSITAVYNGDANFNRATSTASVETVSKVATGVVIDSTAPTRFYGQAVTFTATVTLVSPTGGYPTGSVAFYNGATLLGSAHLAGGAGVSTASLTVSTLDAGALAITAVYAGDASSLASTSAPITETVNPAATATTLTLPSGPAFFGQPQTLVATVATLAPGVGVATGTVKFYAGTNLLGSIAMTNGVATLVTTGIGSGAQTLTAVFVGSTNFQTSTSPPASQSVAVASTRVVLAAPTTVLVGMPTTFTAVVSPIPPATGVPGGYVLFEDGLVPIASARIDARGVATITTSSLSLGAHSITAIYGGDGRYNISTSTAKTTTVIPYVGGYVYLDANANGGRDAADQPLANRVVYLDVARTGAYAAGDPTATTDAAGHFLFPGYAPGRYAVAELTSRDVNNRYTLDRVATDAAGNVLIGVTPLSTVLPTPVVAAPFPSGPVAPAYAKASYVQSLYRAVLGREGTTAEVAGWVNQLNRGVSRQQVSQGIVNLPEHRQQEVAAYYAHFLHRGLDGTAAGWVNELLKGTTEEQVVDQILASPEYQGAHQSASAFVSDLYSDVLGRAATPAELAGGLGQLAAGRSRQTLINAVVSSPEANQQLATALNRVYLRRAPDPTTTSQALAALVAPGGSPSAAAVSILAGDAFYRKSQGLN